MSYLDMGGDVQIVCPYCSTLYIHDGNLRADQYRPALLPVRTPTTRTRDDGRGSLHGTIAIAGAGIAGLSAAIACKLAGFDVAIFEREQALEEIAPASQLGPNATRIMEGWDLDLLGTSVEPEAIELQERDERARFSTPSR